MVRWHDEAFAAWRSRDRRRGDERAREVADRLGPALPLYLRFFRADNATAGKSTAPVEWFERVVGDSAAG